jgi:hypothetical protein
MTEQDRALAKVKSLANLMRMKREQDDRFVILLGAGASLSSGVPNTPTIMQELLAKYGGELEGASLEQRFDKLWRGTNDADRARFLQSYLDRPGSVGYEKLAELIEEDYFEIVLTFNFDELLENALRRKGVDFRKVIRGETNDSEMQKLVDSEKPRFKVVKLHGSLSSTDYFVFDARELRHYPEPIEALVNRITRRDILVCGYAFNDVCVTRAFSETGNSIVCVNPGGVPGNLSTFLKDRRSEDKEILLEFDSFFSELHRELLESAPQSEEKPPVNPFKFLEGYDEQDKDSFKGRDEEADKFFKFLGSKQPPNVIIISGRGKAGKTSFVRAGLLARLDTEKYVGYYVRCPTPDPKTPLETRLADDLARIGRMQTGVDLPSALTCLAKLKPEHRAVLFLDQFERVTGGFEETKQVQRKLNKLLREQLSPAPVENLTLVLVVTDEGGLGTLLAQECSSLDLEVRQVSCPPLERDGVVEIMQSIATAAGFEFDQKIIQEMASKYDLTRNSPTPDTRFTLAHIQAVCHILAGTRSVTYDAYKGAFDQNLGALHQAINVSDITSFVEECAWPDSVWVRNMIKVPLKESKELIAKFIRDHYQELLPPSNPPGRRQNADSASTGDPK